MKAALPESKPSDDAQYEYGIIEEEDFSYSTADQKEAEAKLRRERERYKTMARDNGSGIAAIAIPAEKIREIDRVMGKPMGINGVLVVYMDHSSPAYKAGIREGMIVSFIKSGKLNMTVTAQDYFNSIMQSMKPGEKIQLKVWRMSQEDTISKERVGEERKGKWYQDKIVFTFGQKEAGFAR